MRIWKKQRSREESELEARRRKIREWEREIERLQCLIKQYENIIEKADKFQPAATGREGEENKS